MKFVLYTDKNGKKKLRKSDEDLKIEDEEGKRKKKRIENDKWLNKWKDNRREMNQERYIEYLRRVLPEERWNGRLIRRFIIKVDVGDDNECWEWKSAFSKNGYGVFEVAYKLKYKLEKAHRFMMILIYGKIPDGMIVIHKCDNRKCVNPNHLSMGTYQDNIDDMYNKGRDNMPSGENHWHSLVTEDEAKKYRDEYLRDSHLNINSLAVKYNISYYVMWSILNNKSYVDLSYVVPSSRSGREGENSGKSIYSWDKINRIREDFRTGKFTVYELSKKYDIPRGTMSRIISNLSWCDDNYQQWYDKYGRKIANSSKAESRHTTKYTWNLINEIREKYKRGLGKFALSKEYGIPHSSIYNIVSNRQWFNMEFQKWIEENSELVEMIEKGRKPGSKLSWIEVDKIRELWKSRKCRKIELSKMFGISLSQLNNILSNKSWFSSKYEEWLNKK